MVHHVPNFFRLEFGGLGFKAWSDSRFYRITDYEVNTGFRGLQKVWDLGPSGCQTAERVPFSLGSERPSVRFCNGRAPDREATEAWCRSPEPKQQGRLLSRKL